MVHLRTPCRVIVQVLLKEASGFSIFLFGDLLDGIAQSSPSQLAWCRSTTNCSSWKMPRWNEKRRSSSSRYEKESTAGRLTQIESKSGLRDFSLRIHFEKWKEWIQTTFWSGWSSVLKSFFYDQRRWKAYAVIYRNTNYESFFIVLLAVIATQFAQLSITHRLSWKCQNLVKKAKLIKHATIRRKNMLILISWRSYFWMNVFLIS